MSWAARRGGIGFCRLDEGVDRTTDVVVASEKKNVVLNFRVSNPLGDCAKRAEFVVVVTSVLDEDGNSEFGIRNSELPLVKGICKDRIRTNSDGNILRNVLDEMREDRLSRKRQQRFGAGFREGQRRVAKPPARMKACMGSGYRKR